MEKKPRIGHKIPRTERGEYPDKGHRDAYHIPGILVTAAGDQEIQAGDNIRFVDYTNYEIAEKCEKAERHGVADPFIKSTIGDGEAFLVLLDPDMTQGLTHHFELIEPTGTILPSRRRSQKRRILQRMHRHGL